MPNPTLDVDVIAWRKPRADLVVTAELDGADGQVMLGSDLGMLTMTVVEARHLATALFLAAAALERDL